MTINQERRSERSDGKKGRRMSDKVCPLHDLIWDAHDDDKKEHRDIVCKKIEGKADAKEFSGLKKFVATMVTLCCVIVGGIAAWLKSDMNKVETNITRIHQRISEQAEQRLDGVQKMNETLSSIDNTLYKMNYRLSVLEDTDGKNKSMRLRTP